jgi:hypothetical protein
MRERKESDNEKPKPIKTPGTIWKDVIFEQIPNECFLVYDRAKGEVSVKSFLIHEGKEYRAIDKLSWPSACLPKGIDEQEEPLTKEQLVEKLCAHKFDKAY